MKITPENRIYLGFFTALILSVGLSGLSLWQLQRVTRSVRHVEDAHRILESLDGLVSFVDDAQEAERGYILSGNDYFLNAFHAAAPVINHQLLNLQNRVHDPEQSARLAVLGAKIRTRLENVTEMIALRQEDGYRQALNQLLRRKEPDAMAEIRSAVQEMKTSERSKLAAREAYEERNVGLVVAILAMGIAFGIAAAAAAAYFLHQHLQEKAKAHRALQEAYGVLEDKVRERTSKLADLNQTLVREIQEKNEIHGRLESTIRDLENFASIISHDVQAPLRKIMMFCDLLMENAFSSLDEKSRDYLHRVKDSASRMNDLVDNLAQYSRAAQGNVRFDDVNVNTIVDQVLSDLEVEVAKRQPKISVHPLPTVRGNPALMRQVLQNLIGNALKFTDKTVPAIDISAEPGGPDWTISVHDNGIGIDSKEQRKIFDMFQRSAGSAAFPGQGIGLAVCKRIIERHGGRIWVESEPGHGSTFRFTLPAA